MDHLDTLFDCADQILELDTLQGWIDNARMAAPTNEVVQRNLDRQQDQVNRKRVAIEVMMADIRTRN